MKLSSVLSWELVHDDGKPSSVSPFNQSLAGMTVTRDQTNKKLSLVSPFNQALVGMPMPSADQTLAGAPMLPANQTLAGTPMLTC